MVNNNNDVDMVINSNNLAHAWQVVSPKRGEARFQAKTCVRRLTRVLKRHGSLPSMRKQGHACTAAPNKKRKNPHWPDRPDSFVSALPYPPPLSLTSSKSSSCDAVHGPSAFPLCRTTSSRECSTIEGVEVTLWFSPVPTKRGGRQKERTQQQRCSSSSSTKQAVKTKQTKPGGGKLRVKRIGQRSNKDVLVLGIRNGCSVSKAL